MSSINYEYSYEVKLNELYEILILYDWISRFDNIRWIKSEYIKIIIEIRIEYLMIDIKGNKDE